LEGEGIPRAPAGLCGPESRPGDKELNEGFKKSRKEEEKQERKEKRRDNQQTRKIKLEQIKKEKIKRKLC
jgi:hypothetical protein